MKRLITIIALFLLAAPALSQDTLRFKNQYKAEAKGIEVQFNGVKYTPDAKGELLLKLAPQDSILVSGKDYDAAYFSLKNADENKTISLHKKFSWTDLLTPMFYIISGGIWFILFVVFAETGLFAGFFLPGDSLLFVTGIYSSEIVQSGMGISGAGSFVDLIILGILISIAGILGNFVGYWFGKKSGPFLFERKDTFFFRKKYLYQAKDFYDKHGGGAVVIARFLPIIRTFAPIVAGIVGMEKKKFTYYNIVGCLAWVFTMLLAGHYLEQLFLHAFNFDLKEHLEVIVIGIVLVTTAPILIKLIFGKTKSAPLANDQPVQ
jgi:membrane-associated protein